MADWLRKRKKNFLDEWFNRIFKKDGAWWVIHRAVKGMHCSKLGMWKGYHLWIKGARKGYLFHQKWYTELKGLASRMKFCWVTPTPLPGKVFYQSKPGSTVLLTSSIAGRLSCLNCRLLGTLLLELLTLVDAISIILQKRNFLLIIMNFLR